MTHYNKTQMHFASMSYRRTAWKPNDPGRGLKPVVCRSTGEEFPSLGDAAKALEVTPGYLSRCIITDKLVDGKLYEYK